MEIDSKSLAVRLSRMVASGELRKHERGKYEISPNVFIPTWNEKMELLYNTISTAFPFISFCIWDIMDLRRFSHHINNQEIIYIDVEKDGAEAVFHYLQNHKVVGDKVVALSPSIADYERYIGSRPAIVVRQLVSRAPLSDNNKTTLEKIMVDANIDHDFFAFQGYEIQRIFRNIYSKVKVNERRLMAYAKRRHGQTIIQQLINNKDNYDND